jgi:hypothetical protein
MFCSSATLANLSCLSRRLGLDIDCAHDRYLRSEGSSSGGRGPDGGMCGLKYLAIAAGKFLRDASLRSG